MRRLASIWYVVAGLLLFAHAAANEAMAVGLLALAVSAFAVLVVHRSTMWATSSLVLFGFVCAFAASAGESILLPGVALVLILHGWDMTLASRRLIGLEADDVRPLLWRYGLSSAVIAAAAVGLLLIAAFVRIRLSFGVAAGLGAGFLSLAVLLGVLVRPRKVSPVLVNGESAGTTEQGDEPPSQ